MSVVPGEIVKRRGKLSLKSHAVICESVSACTVGCTERRRRFMSAVPEGCAERRRRFMSAVPEWYAERRRRFMSAVPEGYAEGGGDL